MLKVLFFVWNFSFFIVFLVMSFLFFAFFFHVLLNKIFPNLRTFLFSKKRTAFRYTYTFLHFYPFIKPYRYSWPSRQLIQMYNPCKSVKNFLSSHIRFFSRFQRLASEKEFFFFFLKKRRFCYHHFFILFSLFFLFIQEMER